MHDQKQMKTEIELQITGRIRCDLTSLINVDLVAHDAIKQCATCTQCQNVRLKRIVLDNNSKLRYNVTGKMSYSVS